MSLRIHGREVRFLSALGALLMASGLTHAQQSGPSTSAEVLTEMRIIQRVTGALDRSMDYLASKQQPDGSWHKNNAVNAIALLAFMGRGHTPLRGPYRDVLERGKNFILASARADGFLSFGSMYEHGLATLALAEMYGMDPDPELEEKLRKAVDLIVRCQSGAGGWRYQPNPGDHDLSVTVMQIVALRAANNAEIPVPAQTIEKAIGYLRSSSSPTGGYSYQPGGGPGPQTTAAGIISMQLLGQYNDPTVAKALTYLNQLAPKWGGLPYFYYFHYYAIQAQYQAGGRTWNEWHPLVRELFLEKQNADGSWDLAPGSSENEGVVGPNKIYWTGMASLVLEIYMHFLPAYQR